MAEGALFRQDGLCDKSYFVYVKVASSDKVSFGTNSMSILCRLRNNSSSSLCCARPVAFHKAIFELSI